jgi:hypothetical protein
MYTGIDVITGGQSGRIFLLTMTQLKFFTGKNVEILPANMIYIREFSPVDSEGVRKCT